MDIIDIDIDIEQQMLDFGMEIVRIMPSVMSTMLYLCITILYIKIFKCLSTWHRSSKNDVAIVLVLICIRGFLAVVPHGRAVLLAPLYACLAFNLTAFTLL
jgi:hypothetical protein